MCVGGCRYVLFVIRGPRQLGPRVERRRLANKRWRDAHPGYMAQKSREARQRRRLALETEGDAN